MMRVVRRVLAGLCLTVFATWAASGEAADYGSPRQYYSPWEKHPKADYYYRNYYYKPNPEYAGYKHHYVILHPSKPKHCYFYNPYKKAYWGRCELYHGGEPEYSLLAPEYRKPSLDDIPERAFPEPAKLPPIPESSDGAPPDLPPDDAPEGFAVPAVENAEAPPEA